MNTDDRILLLKALTPHEFGIKPTKGELMLSLIENYGLEREGAQQLFVTCLRDDLITIDSLAKRISVTDKGLRLLQTYLDMSSANTNVQVSRSDSNKNVTWWQKNKWWVIPALIAVTIFVLSMIAHINGLL